MIVRLKEKLNGIKNPFVAILIVVFFSILLICSPFVLKKSLGSIFNAKVADNLNIEIETPNKVLLGSAPGWEQFKGAAVYNKDNFIVTIHNNENEELTNVTISLTNEKEVTGTAHGVANFTCDEEGFTISKKESKSVKCYGVISSAYNYVDTYETITYSYEINGNTINSISDVIYFYHTVNPNLKTATNAFELSELEKEINIAQSKADLVDEEFYNKTDINNTISDAVNVYVDDNSIKDAIENAINSLKEYTKDSYAIPEIPGDYSKLDELLEKANKIVNEVPNYTSLALYTDASWNNFDNARKTANNLSRNYTKQKQGIIDNAEEKLSNAMNNGLTYHNGYYESLKSILSVLKDDELITSYADLSNITLNKKTVTIKNNVYNYYTDETWSALKSAVKNIDAHLLANDQDRIETIAKDVSDAYYALLKSPAVYTDVNKVINGYLNSEAYKNDWYTTDSKNEYEAYINDVIKYDINTGSYITVLTIDKQSTVDNFVVKLNNIKLKYKNADYTSVTEAINNYLNSDAYKNHWYTTDSKNKYEVYIADVINYDIKNKTYTSVLTIDKQSTVDEFINGLNSIKLNLKDANYSKLTKRINNYLNSEAYKGHWFINEDEEAINNYITSTINYNIGDEKYNTVLTIDKQQIIDEYNNKLSELISNARYKIAEEKYTKLNTTIESFANSNAWVNDWYVDNEYKNNVTNYINGNYDVTITINNSSNVDALIDDFNNNVSKLSYKKADGYSLVEEYKNIFTNLVNSADYTKIYNVEARQYMYDYLLIFNDAKHSKMNITINNQSKMNDFVNGIKDFYDNINDYKNPANYGALYEALNSINKNLYTAESWDAYVNSDAYATAVYELDKKSYKYDEQDKVKEVVGNLISAREVLVYGGADYSELVDLYTSFIVNDDYQLYTYRSKKLVKDYYYEKIKTSLKIDEQDKISNYASFLKNKISNVKYKLANYNELKNAISSFNGNKYIKNSDYLKVKKFIKSYNRKITINEQNKVTDLTNEFNELVSKLKSK